MLFVDTNILLYRISTAPAEAAKQAIAAELLQWDDLVLSVQVLHDFMCKPPAAPAPTVWCTRGPWP